MCARQCRFRAFYPRVCPRNSICRPQFSARSCQRGFIFSINAIFFSRRQRLICFSRPIPSVHVLVALVVDQTMALVLPGKALNRIVFVLMNALIEESVDTDIERSRPAGEDIDPEFVMQTVAHAEKSSIRSLGRTPHIGMAGDTFSRSLHSPSVSRFAGSFVLRRDDRRCRCAGFSAIFWFAHV
jgi:hypothetical protein